MDDYIQILEQLKDFASSGGRCYRSWVGLPENLKNLLQVIDFLNDELSFLEHLNYSILELGPQGGRWTFQILRLLLDLGMPRSLTYDLIGTSYEFELVARDVLTPCVADRDCILCSEYHNFRFDQPYRISSKNKHVLISEITSHRLFSTLLDASDLDSKAQYNLIICMDNLIHFSPECITILIKQLISHLKLGGTILFNLHFEDWLTIADYLDSLGTICILAHTVQGSTIHYVALRERVAVSFNSTGIVHVP